MLTRRLIFLSALAALPACTLGNQSAPSLAGPSELGVSLIVTASPDILNQDGVSTSAITVSATS